MILQPISPCPYIQIRESTQKLTVADNLFFQSSHDCLQLQSLQASERSTDSKIQFNPRSYRIGLILIEINRCQSSLANMAWWRSAVLISCNAIHLDLRAFRVTELGSLHLDSTISRFCLIADF